MNWLNTIARRMGFVPRKKNSFAPRRFRPALEVLDRRDVPAVLVPPSSISGYVYADANNDGIFESTESGIAGVTVSLSGSDVFGSAVNLTTTTNASGAYSFSQISPGVQLNPGTYTVSETTPSGYMDGIDSIGTPASGSVVNHQFVNVALGTLSAGVNAVNYDFGEVLCPAPTPAPASLSGTVYVDNNGSDMLTAGDAGLGGQTIYIWNASGFSASTTTAANGTYSFGNLTPGVYSLGAFAAAGYTAENPNVGSAGGTAFLNTGNNSEDIFSVSLNAGATAANYNLPEYVPSGLSGYVYNDANNNGVKDSGEAGIANVTVTLTGANGFKETTTTNCNGFYQFSNLYPGTYTITESLPAGYTAGKTTQGTPGNGTVSTGAISNIALASGTTGANNDFGDILPVSIGGIDYVDNNGTDTFGSGDTGLGGQTIYIWNASGFSASTTTAANGTYSFSNLAPGTYSLGAFAAAGYTAENPNVGSAGGTPYLTTSNNSEGFLSVVLNSGTNATNYNIPQNKPTTSIGGTVYVDNNGSDTLTAGDAGLGGQTIYIWNTSGFSASTTTAANGTYSFSNLTPGVYSLGAFAAAGYTAENPNVGSAGGTPYLTTSNNSEGFLSVSLNAGGTAANYNLPEYVPSGLSGYVYNDANNNGVKDSGEAGIANVTVTLTGANGFKETTTTNCNGLYQFSNLYPGTYTITESLPAGYTAGKTTQGTPGNGTVSTGAISNITLTSGTTGANNDFGDLSNYCCVTGTVYNDCNKNDCFDSGDASLCGITVTLCWNGGCESTTTTSNGSYCFNNVGLGCYTLCETPPSNCTIESTQCGLIGSLCSSSTIGLTVGAGCCFSGCNFADLSCSSGCCLPAVQATCATTTCTSTTTCCSTPTCGSSSCGTTTCTTTSCTSSACGTTTCKTPSCSTSTTTCSTTPSCSSTSCLTSLLGSLSSCL